MKRGRGEVWAGQREGRAGQGEGRAGWAREHSLLSLKGHRRRTLALAARKSCTAASPPASHLGKQRLAGPRRPVHQDVPVQAAVLLGVPRRYGDVPHTCLQAGLWGGNKTVARCGCCSVPPEWHSQPKRQLIPVRAQKGMPAHTPTPTVGSTTYTEDHALQGVLRLTEQPPADLWGNGCRGYGCPRCSHLAMGHGAHPPGHV